MQCIILSTEWVTNIAKWLCLSAASKVLPISCDSLCDYLPNTALLTLRCTAGKWALCTHAGRQCMFWLLL